MKSSLIRNAENPDFGAAGILSKAIDNHPAGIPQPLFEEIVIFRSAFCRFSTRSSRGRQRVALKDCSNRIWDYVL